MPKPWRWLILLPLVPILSSFAAGDYKCLATPNPPKLPVTRASGRAASRNSLRVVELAGMSDTWKSSRREIGSIPAGTMVEVLDDLIVVEAPDIVWVSRPIEEFSRFLG